MTTPFTLAGFFGPSDYAWLGAPPAGNPTQFFTMM